MFVFPSFFNLGVLSVPALQHGAWYTLFTSMFLHSGYAHLICNMVSLFYLGTMCEQVFGKAKYLILYFASGFLGGIAYVGVNFALGSTTGAVGASGAIFGLFGAYGLLLFKERKVATVFARPTSKQEVISYLFFLAINVMIGLSGPGIANEAHIGGMVSGFIIAAIMYPMIAKRQR